MVAFALSESYMKGACCSAFKDREKGNSWTFDTGYITVRDWVCFQKKNILTAV